MNQIVTEARRWIGTPFHHQGRVKGVGCDCLGMVVGVASELKLEKNGTLLASLDNPRYSRQPNTAELLTKLQENLALVTEMQVGDLAVITMISNPQHMGIITDYVHGGFGLLHALPSSGVVEHRLDKGWAKRIVKLYRI